MMMINRSTTTAHDKAEASSRRMHSSILLPSYPPGSENIDEKIIVPFQASGDSNRLPLDLILLRFIQLSKTTRRLPC